MSRRPTPPVSRNALTPDPSSPDEEGRFTTLRSSASNNNNNSNNININNNSGTPKKPLCRFFVLHNGKCRYGSKCAYSHEIPEGTSFEEAKQSVPCPFFGARGGGCRYGDHCQLMHHDTHSHLVPASSTTMNTTNNNKMGDDEEDANRKQRATNTNNRSDGMTAANDPQQEDENNKNEENNEEVFTTCGICLEDCPQRQFGLLSCCNHAFCYDCLMEWRKEGTSEALDRRSCPTCRNHSDYVIPSPVFPTNEGMKQAIVQDYKDRKALIPCRRFQRTGKLGSCPFGSDCFYAHLDRTGQNVKSQDKSMATIATEREQRRLERNIQFHRRNLNRHFQYHPSWDDETLDDDHGEFLLDFLRFLDVHGYPHVRDHFVNSDDDDDDDEYDEEEDDDDDSQSTHRSDFARHVRVHLPVLGSMVVGPEEFAEFIEEDEVARAEWWGSS
jgi:CCCH-type zinc finger/Ring finger domain/Zinc finger C-x8-C-x5-C-x3-H type (and similar)/RNA-binding, Nab2-type zinc finger